MLKSKSKFRKFKNLISNFNYIKKIKTNLIEIFNLSNLIMNNNNELSGSNNASSANDRDISRENLGYKSEINPNSYFRIRGYSPGFNENNTKPAPPPPPPTSGSNVYKPKRGK